MKIKPIWKWSGFISLAIVAGNVVAIHRIPFMSNPNPRLVMGLFVALGVYSITGGIITAKQATGLPTNMLGMLNTLTGVAWLIAAFGLATFPVQS